jgi:hypothetical protein
MSLYQSLISNPNHIKYDVIFKDLTVDTINGGIPILPASIGTGTPNTIAIWSLTQPPIFSDSNITISGVNSNELNNVNSITNEIGNDFIINSNSNVVLKTSQSSKVEINNGILSKCAEFDNENVVCDNYFKFHGTNSSNIDGFGPIMSCQGNSLGIIEQVQPSGAHILLDTNQTTTPALTYVCGGSSGFNGVVSLSANGQIPNDGTIYCLPNTCGNTNDVLTLTSAVSGGVSLMTWQPPSGGSTIYPSTVNIPLSSYNYYNKLSDTRTDFWYQTNKLNGALQDGTLNQDMGTFSVNLNSGIWRIMVVAWVDNVNGGITNIVFNGNITSIDTSTGSDLAPLTWEETILTDGLYGVQIINGGTSSSGYNMFFGSQFITLSRVADLP